MKITTLHYLAFICGGVLSPHDKSIAEHLWNRGNDTLTIAQHLKCHEAAVVRALAQMREAKIRPDTDK